MALEVWNQLESHLNLGWLHSESTERGCCSSAGTVGSLSSFSKNELGSSASVLKSSRLNQAFLPTSSLWCANPCTSQRGNISLDDEDTGGELMETELREDAIPNVNQTLRENWMRIWVVDHDMEWFVLRVALCTCQILNCEQCSPYWLGKGPGYTYSINRQKS